MLTCLHADTAAASTVTAGSSRRALRAFAESLCDTDGFLDLVLPSIAAQRLEVHIVHAVIHNLAVVFAIPKHELVGLALHVLRIVEGGSVNPITPSVEELGIELDDGLCRDAVGVVDAVVVGREGIGTCQLRLADDDADDLAFIFDGVGALREGDVELGIISARLRQRVGGVLFKASHQRFLLAGTVLSAPQLPFADVFVAIRIADVGKEVQLHWRLCGLRSSGSHHDGVFLVNRIEHDVWRRPCLVRYIRDGHLRGGVLFLFSRSGGAIEEFRVVIVVAARDEGQDECAEQGKHGDEFFSRMFHFTFSI